MDLPEFLVNHSDGEVRLAGHRISLFEIVDRYLDGDSPEILHDKFPTLPLALIHKVIAFYLENQESIDPQLAAVRAELHRQERCHQPGAAVERIRQRMSPEKEPSPTVPPGQS